MLCNANAQGASEATEARRSQPCQGRFAVLTALLPTFSHAAAAATSAVPGSLFRLRDKEQAPHLPQLPQWLEQLLQLLLTLPEELLKTQKGPQGWQA